jgi:hypothetical protein
MMERRALAVLSIAVVLLIAGCSAPTGSTPTDGPTAPDPTSEPTAVTTSSPPDTPTPEGHSETATAEPTTAEQTTVPETTTVIDESSSVLGRENGIWYNESLPITPSDGYNRTEIELVRDRMMARIEVIRGHEFTDDVSVEIRSRDEYRDSSPYTFSEDAWRDLYWEAAFIIEGTESSAEVFTALYGRSVAGFYSNGNIVIVAGDTDEISLDRGTLVHELEHALQEQALTLAVGGVGPRDETTAGSSVVEGDANAVMDRYEERCEGNWSCIPQGNDGSDSSQGPANQGLFASIWLPYSDGPTFVEALHDRGGWTAVDEAFESPPISTEQVIHPEKYPNETPVIVRVEDRSSEEWRRLDRTGIFGEATFFAMLWSNGVIPSGHVRSEDARWNYSHPATAGWGGDRFVAYTNGTTDAYVLKSTWDTERDAREFYEAYVDLLETNGGNEVEPGVYRLPEGSGFEDVFRVERDGNRVIVVNAPTVEDLEEVHTGD